MTLKFSIIIPFKEPTPYLYECLDNIVKQTCKNYEVILLPDETYLPSIRTRQKEIRVIPTGKAGPAEKRDIGSKKATGEILAYIDDDAYPDRDWLRNALKHFDNLQIAAVCGPGMTPPGSSRQEHASGWFSASPLGGGTYTYRFLPQNKRFVDDYPSMNLLVRKKDFFAVGGFDSHYWPGEDTKLCLDLVHTLGKKIIYDPKVLVYHHRRPVWIPHLSQNGNFGLHRGYFARVLPKTSFRLIYFLPSFLVLVIIILPFVTLPFYIALLLTNGIWITAKSRSLFQGLISLPVVFVTHFWYGIRFMQGFLFTKKLRR